MVSKFQWKPFWLATQRDPQNDWTATQNRVNYDVFAQAPLSLLTQTWFPWKPCSAFKAGPLTWVFGHFWLFLHYGTEEVKRHLRSKFHNKIQRKGWSNVPPKLLACSRFLYKVAHKIGRLRKSNRARKIEFNFFIFWTIFIKFSTLVHHVHGYNMSIRYFNSCPGT